MNMKSLYCKKGYGMFQVDHNCLENDFDSSDKTYLYEQQKSACVSAVWSVPLLFAT